MADWVMSVVEAMGYAGIALLMFAENVFPPIPSEVIMPLAGYMSVEGEMTLWGIIAAGAAGSTLGALPFYWIARRIGKRRLKGYADNSGRWFAMSSADIEKAQGWFDRHGLMAVFFCRLVPGVRSLISIPAGFAKLAFLPFLVCTTLGSLLWTALLACAGHFLGSSFEQAEKYLDPLSWVVVGTVLALYVKRVIRPA